MARKENWLSRAFPSKTFRNLIKEALAFSNSALTPSLMVHPMVSAKFFPVRPASNEFVVAVDPNVERDAQGLPVPPKDIRIGEVSAQVFCDTGRQDVEQMLQVLARAGLTLSDFRRVLEMGCASGRMIRNLHEHAQSHEVWGVDLAAEHIFWCQQNLAPIQFATVTTAPHLPFEDRYFDFMYAGSVFTHIDDLAYTWFLEVRRILQPGGYAYITVQDEDSIRYLEENRATDSWASMVLETRAYADFKRRHGRMFTIGRSLMAHVFYEREHLLKHLGRIFEVISVSPRAYRGSQTGLLLRKPA
jgi:ubiquinone/menaquinone biosynthesis C-methylase UbiE